MNSVTKGIDSKSYRLQCIELFTGYIDLVYLKTPEVSSTVPAMVYKRLSVRKPAEFSDTIFCFRRCKEASDFINAFNDGRIIKTMEIMLMSQVSKKTSSLIEPKEIKKIELGKSVINILAFDYKLNRVFGTTDYDSLIIASVTSSKISKETKSFDQSGSEKGSSEVSIKSDGQIKEN